MIGVAGRRTSRRIGSEEDGTSLCDGWGGARGSRGIVADAHRRSSQVNRHGRRALDRDSQIAGGQAVQGHTGRSRPRDCEADGGRIRIMRIRDAAAVEQRPGKGYARLGRQKGGRIDRSAGGRNSRRVQRRCYSGDRRDGKGGSAFGGVHKLLRSGHRRIARSVAASGYNVAIKGQPLKLTVHGRCYHGIRGRLEGHVRGVSECAAADDLRRGLRDGVNGRAPAGRIKVLRGIQVHAVRSACEQYEVVVRQGGCVLIARSEHRRCHRREGLCGRVIDLGRVDGVPEVVDTTGDQHVAVGQQRGCVEGARRVHLPCCGRPGLGHRVIDLSRCQGAGCLAGGLTARYQDGAVFQHGGRMAIARLLHERCDRRPGLAGRVIEFGLVQDQTAVDAARNQDLPYAQQRGRMALPGGNHGAARGGRRGRGCTALRKEVGGRGICIGRYVETACDQNIAGGQQRGGGPRQHIGQRRCRRAPGIQSRIAHINGGRYVADDHHIAAGKQRAGRIACRSGRGRVAAGGERSGREPPRGDRRQNHRIGREAVVLPVRHDGADLVAADASREVGDREGRGRRVRLARGIRTRDRRTAERRRARVGRVREVRPGHARGGAVLPLNTDGRAVRRVCVCAGQRKGRGLPLKHRHAGGLKRNGGAACSYGVPGHGGPQRSGDRQQGKGKNNANATTNLEITHHDNGPRSTDSGGKPSSITDSI